MPPGQLNNDGKPGDGYYTGCSAGFTCRLVGSCNGGSKFSENGKYCTIDTSGGTDRSFDEATQANQFAYYNKNFCEGGGTCVPPVCSNSCSSSCPVAFQTTPVQIQSYTVGALPMNGMNFTALDSSASVIIPACTVGLKLSGEVSNTASTDNAASATVVIGSAVLPPPVVPPQTPGGAVPSNDIVFLFDLSNMMSDKYSASGNTSTTFLDQAKVYATQLLNNLSSSATSSQQPVKVALVGFYYDSSSSTFVNTKLLDFTDVSTNSAALIVKEKNLSIVPNGVPAYESGITYAETLLANDTTSSSKTIFLFSLGTPTGKIGTSAPGTDCVDQVCIESARNVIKANSTVSVFGIALWAGQKGAMSHMTSQTVCPLTPNFVNPNLNWNSPILGNLETCPNGYPFLIDADKDNQDITDPPALCSALITYLSANTFVTGTTGSGITGVGATSTNDKSSILQMDAIQDILLPAPFVCTGTRMSLPITITTTTGVTLKNLNFTYCPK